MNKAPTKDSRPYHHGDLRKSLLQEAASLLANEGIESLSLRRLADNVGVSRTALYHHFKDKHALLCAIAAEGFAELESIMAGIGQQSSLTPAQRYGLFARNYLDYATQNPARYSLMFGHTLWRQNLADDSLKGVAYQSFKQHLSAVKAWQACGILPQDQDSLRLTQVTWGTLHGLAQLVIDGVYADSNHLDEICQCVGELFSRA